MKIGIITIFDSENFGNQLQAYAMQQVLRRWGAEPVVLKNKPRFRSVWEFLRRGTGLAECIALNRLLGKRRKAKILAFQKARLRVSRRCYCCEGSSRQLGRGWDGFCIGSDQVWNPALGRTGGFQFPAQGPGPVFSYAASFGPAAQPGSCPADFPQQLARIPFLSVREPAGKALVEALTGRTDVQVLPDPTLLLHRRDWEALLEKPAPALPASYVLSYFLGKNGQAAAIRAQAAAHSQTVLDILDSASPFYAIGPGEFLYLIRHAACVYTDSFHAAVFSFLFRRPMVLFGRDGKPDSRLEALAAAFHFSACLARGNTWPEPPAEADYAAGEAALAAARQTAWAFLARALGKEDRAWQPASETWASP